MAAINDKALVPLEFDFPLFRAFGHATGADDESTIAVEIGVRPHVDQDGRSSGTKLKIEDESIAPGSPWENGYIESFNARLRDELLDGEIFYTLREAQIVIESWRRHYNGVRPHASLGYRAPAPEVFVPSLAAWPAAQPRPAPPATLPLAPRPSLN